MNTLSYRTISANEKTVTHKWYIVDAEGQTLGRLSSRVASILKGKNKPYYTPHVDCGDYIIVINAEKIKLTGKKMMDKEYLSHTGYPGGQRSTTPKKLLATYPTRIIEYAVKGMLPKNVLGRQMGKKLFIYTGTEHSHHAQKPETLKF